MYFHIFKLTASTKKPHTCSCCSFFYHKIPGNCPFDIKWLEKPEYKCLSQTQKKFKAKFNVYRKNIDFSTMVENALKSHINSTKHSELERGKKKEKKSSKQFEAVKVDY